MASISSMETVIPQRSLSTPATSEQDVSRASPSDVDSTDVLPPRNAKGKQRATTNPVDYSVYPETPIGRAFSPGLQTGNGDEAMTSRGGIVTLEDYEDDEDDTFEPTSAGKYPPTTEDDAETRRVEETLKRWEIAERQRRKNARLSTTREGTLHSPTSSIVSDVGRRASLLWSSTKTAGQSSRYSPHHHTKLQSTDSLDAVALEAVTSRPTSPSTPNSAVPFVGHNPFDAPSEITSPFSDSHQFQQTAVMNPSSDLSLPSTHPAPPGAPQPLDLPPPRTPPPPTSAPPTARAPPTVSAANKQMDEDPPKFRWWHEWLCGCTESGGHQAGRTNPFE